MKYIQMLNLEDDEFEVTSATTTEEIKKLGWQAGQNTTS